jgi:aldehyde:ferredoxin oxidoreductase
MKFFCVFIKLLKGKGVSMQTAYNGKIARINLSTGTIEVEELDIELAKKFIGGRGLGTKILYDEGIATVDPLSEDNKLIYITGPMTGTKTPASGRYMVVTKSPLTGMIASSNSGGIWGAKLKYAGWDALIVEGKANTPTYINIVDDKIELLPADEYVGMLSEGQISGSDLMSSTSSSCTISFACMEKM